MKQISRIIHIIIWLLFASIQGKAQNYCTYYGGSNYELTGHILVDLNMNVYLAARTNSATKIATPNGYDTSLAGYHDIFICKFNNLGQLEWSTYYGGSFAERPNSMVFDKDSNILLVGLTESTTGIASAGANKPNRSGTRDGFICKFSRNGTFLYGSYVGGDSTDEVNDIAIAANGDYLLLGTTMSVNFMPLGTQQKVNNGKQDMFITRMSSDGVPLWSTYYGDTAFETGNQILCDDQSNVYIAVSTYSGGLATPGAPKTAFDGGVDVVFAKFNASGKLLLSTYMGGSNNENIFEMLWDNNGKIVAVGFTGSSNGIATTGSWQSALNGTYDGFLCKLDTLFQLDYCTYVGGNLLDGLSSVCLDPKGNIYVWGNGNSTSGIATPGAMQEIYAGGTYDAYMQKYSASGSLLWGTYFGGTDQDVSDKVIYGPDHNLHLIGMSYSTTGIATSDAYQKTMGGIGDMFYLKYVLPVETDTCGDYFNNGFTLNTKIQCTRDNEFIFTDTTTFSGSITHFWDFGNGSFGSNQIETVHYDPLVNNQITVKLATTLNNSCTDTATQTIYLISSPEMPVITGNTPVYMGSRQTYSVPFHNGSAYHWFFESGTGSSINASIQIKWLLPDTVDLKVVETNGGGCVSDTGYLQIIVKDPTGLESVADNLWQVYPNPTHDLLCITAQIATAMQAAIFDLQGRLLMSVETDMQHCIHVSDLPEGSYLVKLFTDSGASRNFLFIKQDH